jgi:hypothetical protein
VTTHTFHGDVHVRGLIDGCPRCRELADSPVELDDVMRDHLRDRVKRNMPARSANEAIAMRHINQQETTR